MTIEFYISSEKASPAPTQATTTRNGFSRSKRKGLMYRVGNQLKRVLKLSMRADERGETFWHHLGSSIAIVACICGMLWILGTTPQNHERPSHDVIVQAGE